MCIRDRHEVAEGPYFTKKKDKNKIKTVPELNSRGHNKRVDRSKDMVDWAWIL